MLDTIKEYLEDGVKLVGKTAEIVKGFGMEKLGQALEGAGKVGRAIVSFFKL